MKMNDYKTPTDMGLASKLYDAGKNYGKKAIVAGSLVGLLAAQGCSTLKENYTLNVNGVSVNGQMYADSRGDTVNDATGEKSTFRKALPYIIGALVVGGAAYAISESNDGGSSNTPAPANNGGGGGGGAPGF